MKIDYTALLGEIANWDNAGVNINDIIQDPDKILRDRNETTEVFNDILADDQVTQAILNRKNRVLLTKNYYFRAGSPEDEKPTPEAENLKDQFVKCLENSNMTEVISAILDAPFVGFSIIEIIWGRESGRWPIKELKPRPSNWFRFNKDGELCFAGASNTEAKPVPFGKFMMARHYPTYENPYGIRLLSKCLWPVIFKKSGIKLYSYFTERYGLPFIHGTAPDGAKDEDLSRGAAQLAALRAGGVAMTGYGTAVQLLSADKSSADVYEQYLNRWNAAISKILMGQTLTAELGDSGSFAAAETHKGVAMDIADADRRIVKQAMDELAWLYAQINMPNVAAPVFEYENIEDLSAKADMDTKLYNMGVEFTPEYIEQTYGVDKTLFKIIPKQQGGMSGMFASPKDNIVNFSTPVDGRDEAAAIKALEELTGLSSKELDSAKDISDVEEALLKADMPTLEVERILGEIITAGLVKGFING